MQSEVKKALETLSKATASCMTGDRHIVVLDRGWIFIGNLSFDQDTKVYTLTNCYNIRKWNQGGFGGLTKSAKESVAILDACDPIRFTKSIFTVPISESWGNE